MTSENNTTEQQAEKYLSEWLSNRQFDEFSDHHAIHHQLGPFVTISREAGVGGSEIARELGKKLQWEVIDRQIVDFLSEKYDISKMIVEKLDEKNSAVAGEFFSSWILDRNFSQSTYLHQLNRLVLLAANHGHVIIVGRGAGFILPRNKGLSVRLIASEQQRVKLFAQGKAVSENEALKQIQKIEHQRNAFIKKNFSVNPEDSHQYDLTINVTGRTQEEVVDLIAAAVKRLLGDA